SEAANSAGLSSNTKLVAGAFDHPSAAIGTGVFEPGSMLISTGTSWVGFLPLKDRELAVKNKLLVDPFTHKENGNWGAIFSVSKIGAMVDECINNRFSGISSMDEKYLLFNDESQRSPLGSEGLFVDLTKTSMPEEIFKKKHLCRAVMESAAYMLRRKIESFSDCVPSLSKIVMCGGPSQSDTWTQIVSDVTGIPLSIAGGQSSGAIGAAIMAGVGAGVFGDLKTGFSCMKFKTKKIEPDKNAKNKYNEYYRSLVERKLI
ncbi:MAG TPA: FGGY-family carbohydrate kinase, partial [Victivallales bacterium]|nr:FGGY-family carbohydrate kinase [Victivallales bacterium]